MATVENRIDPPIRRRGSLQSGGTGLDGALAVGRSEIAFGSETMGHTSLFGRAKSLVILYLYGAPSQMDTLDPKPLAPVERRGEFKPIATSLPGVAACEHWSGAYWRMFFDAGIKARRVIGATDRQGGYPIHHATNPKEIPATMYHLLGFDPQRMTIPDRFGRPLHLIPHGDVVRELLA